MKNGLEFLLEHHFGLSRLSLSAWAVREIKHTLVSAAFGLALVEGLYVLLRYVPGGWTVGAALGWVGVSIVIISRNG